MRRAGLARLLLLLTDLARSAKFRPSASSLQAARQAFATRLDAESDAALAPLLLDEEGRYGEEAANAPVEKRPTLEELLAPSSKRPRRRGFQWHDPKRRWGPPPPTFAERLDAASEAAIGGAADDDERAQPSADALRERRTSPMEERLGSGPERAAAWLIRKYDEVYGVDEDATDARSAASDDIDDVEDVDERQDEEVARRPGRSPAPWRRRRGKGGGR